MKRSALAALLAVTAAEARTKLLDSWQNEQSAGNKPTKIAVIAVLPDALTRQAVDMDVVAALQKKGHAAVEGTKLQGLSGGIRGKIDREKAVATLEANGADAVIVLFYNGGGVSGEYERSNYWARYEGTAVGGWGAYDWAQPYFVDVYSIQQGSQAIVEKELVVWVETSYYDLKTKEPVWRIVTETKDIEHSDAVKAISNCINSEMRKAGL